MSTIVNIYTNNGLGDSIFNMVYFATIKNYIETNNIYIHYYVKIPYISPTCDFITSKNVIIKPLNEAPPNTLNSWIGCSYPEIGYFWMAKHMHIFLAKHFTRLGRILKLPSMDTFIYEDPDLLIRYDKLHADIKNFDILVLNSRPCSGQYVYNESDWTNNLNKLSAKYKIVVTTPEPGFICTQDYNMSIKDIAALSTHAPIIIAVNSGPFVGCHNVYTMKYAKKIYCFDAHNNYGGHHLIVPVTQWAQVIPDIYSVKIES